MFKIKDKYKQTLETMKLFGNTKNVIDKRKNSENVLISEVVQLVLVQWILGVKQYQRKSEVLYTFSPNISYAYLLNVE